MLALIGTIVVGVIASLLAAIFYDSLKPYLKKIKRFFFRGQPIDEPEPKRKVKKHKQKQIKILSITASPEQENDLLYEQEQDSLLNVFKSFDPGELFLDMPDPVFDTISEIENYLEDGRHDVLLISAHGGINKNGEGVLSLEDHKGNLKEVTGSKLVEVLKEVHFPLIIVLSSCHSARQEPALMPVARSLFDAGIHTVIGMKQKISHLAAIDFNRAFFKALCGEKTVKQAFEQGKQAIMKGEQQRIEEIAGWDALKEYEIPQLLTKDEQLTKEGFSAYRIEAPGRPESHQFLGAKHLDRGFIGRRRILRDIYKKVEEGAGALVLKGPGGIGKSTLTTRAAANLRRKGYDFIVIRGETTVEGILQAISNKAAAAGMQQAGQVASADADVKEKLKVFLDHFLLKQKIVVIFDNFEENQAEEKDGDFIRERLKDFLWYFRDALKHQASILFFSTRYRLPGFEALEIEPGEFTLVEFRKMLLKGEALKRLEGKCLDVLLHEVGGNPRALELLDRIACQEFGGREFTWEELKEHIPELRERLIHKAAKGDDFTPLFLDRLIGYLTGPQRRVVDVLSVFRNPVKKDALEAHDISVSRTDRRRLEDFSLLEYMKESEMYYVHRLTAQYLLLQMEEGVRKRCHLRSAEYFEGIEDEEGKGIVEYYMESRWHFLEAGEWNRAAEITFSLEDYLTLHGSPRLSFELLEEVGEKELTDKNRSIVFHQMGMLYQGFGDYGAALKKYEESLEIKEKIGDIKGVSQSLHNIGAIYQEKGDYAAALKKYEESLEIKEKIGDIKGVSDSLHQIGRIYQEKGDYAAALKKYEESLEIDKKIGDIKGVSYSLGQIGIIYQNKGNYKKALENFQKVVKISEEIGDIKSVSIGLHQIGSIYEEKGDYAAALKKYEESLEIDKKIGDIPGMAISIGQMGKLFFEQNKHENALKLFIQAFLIFAKLESPYVKLAQEYIFKIKEKIQDHRFLNILKEFNLPPETFDEVEPGKVAAR